jgi:hypothetical protein
MQSNINAREKKSEYRPKGMLFSNKSGGNQDRADQWQPVSNPNIELAAALRTEGQRQQDCKKHEHHTNSAQYWSSFHEKDVMPPNPYRSY